MDAIGLNLQDLLQSFGTKGNVELITLSGVRHSNELSNSSTWQEIERRSTESNIRAISVIAQELTMSELCTVNINVNLSNLPIKFASNGYALYGLSKTIGTKALSINLSINGADLVVSSNSSLPATTNYSFTYIYCVLVFH